MIDIADYAAAILACGGGSRTVSRQGQLGCVGWGMSVGTRRLGRVGWRGWVGTRRVERVGWDASAGRRPGPCRTSGNTPGTPYPCGPARRPGVSWKASVGKRQLARASVGPRPLESVSWRASFGPRLLGVRVDHLQRRKSSPTCGFGAHELAILILRHIHLHHGLRFLKHLLVESLWHVARLRCLCGGRDWHPFAPFPILAVSIARLSARPSLTRRRGGGKRRGRHRPPLGRSSALRACGGASGSPVA